MLANAGVPMIFIQWPLMLAALAPIIAVEAWLIRRWTPVSSREALIGVAKANLLSTLIGVPLAWLAMLAVEFAVLVPPYMVSERYHLDYRGPVWSTLEFLFSAAWLDPDERSLHWMVPAAVGLLLVPCFYASVVIERWACLRTWRTVDPTAVRRGVFRANLASYLLLFALACGYVGFQLATKGVHTEPYSAEGTTVPKPPDNVTPGSPDASIKSPREVAQ
jgi:hypothetical protein